MFRSSKKKAAEAADKVKVENDDKSKEIEVVSEESETKADVTSSLIKSLWISKFHEEKRIAEDLKEKVKVENDEEKKEIELVAEETETKVEIKAADVTSSFLKSLWISKFHKEDSSTEDEKEKVKVENDGEKKEIELVAEETDIKADIKQDMTSSLLKKLWNSKRNMSVKVKSASETNGDASETSGTDQKNEESEAPTKSRLSGLFRGKATEEEEAIEVEVKPNKTLQIHDSSRSFNSHRSIISSNPNRQSVFDEALEMLTASFLIYVFADLREMAREGIIDAKELLEDPTPVRQVLSAIKDHRAALEERAIDHDKLSETLSAMKELHEQSTPVQTANIGHLLQGGAEAALAAFSSQESLSKSKESVLDQFHDEKSTQGVVYGIALNHLRKRVTIVFRGSVTQQDFLTDSRSAQKKVVNPVAALVADAPEQIQIHTGFYTYLFAKDKDDEQRFLCQRILADVKRLLKENPGYQLYCTGHSLGGALATLCGFYAAVDDELVQNGPVVVISVASPQVGHKTFSESFHALELLGRLQHLRVANREDMITHLPFVHIKAHVLSPVAVAMFGAGNLYKHCGIHLELKSVQEENEHRTEHFVCHPNKTRCMDKESYSEEFKRAIDAAKMLYESVVPLGKGDVDALTSFHSCKEYEARLMARKEHLQTVTLDDLYRDEGIVGAALAQNLSEQSLPMP